MTPLDPLVLLAAFACMFCLDFAWAVYTTHVGSGAAARAGGWATALHLLGAATTIIYVDDHRYLIGTALGAFAGTWAGVRWAKRKGRDNGTVS
jgi:hypothetical protein